jgi:hypothetical protein
MARDQRHDPRIADALAHAQTYGLAEYLAAGPQLLHKWQAGQDTHPRGAALVTAALDCRRAGYITALPTALLNQIHVRYLPTNPRAHLEDLDSAWSWATQRWRGATALLEPTAIGDDTVIVFDYLLDHVQRTTPVDHPTQPPSCSPRSPDATTATAIGTHARNLGNYQLAHPAYTRAHTLHADASGPEHPDTLTSRGNLAGVLWALGRFDEAEQDHRAPPSTHASESSAPERHERVSSRQSRDSFRPGSRLSP